MVSYVSYYAGITLAESAGKGAVCPHKERKWGHVLFSQRSKLGIVFL